MAALTWLLIPVAAALVASVWGGWANRRRTTTPDAAGVAGYERFRAAMERSRAPGDRSPGVTAEYGADRRAAVSCAPDGPARTAD
ncbi:hypothetical protein [Streptomyces boncukensis]|uniref:Uncharacterized protein n=1 Tax=Streptomyces boncukensis TaxID=2711219 RepID=A0A6G4WQ46_9ACTN|nr:hypothetical protein [Streptomyces boncukensis]NGO67389.1 hypothetical protein [Streptomyces boncukensis]